MLGVNSKEKIPMPIIISRLAPAQWFILKITPKPDRDTDTAPVINANFFIWIVFMGSLIYDFSGSPFFEWLLASKD
jgi:hypothetical protein